MLLAAVWLVCCAAILIMKLISTTFQPGSLVLIYCSLVILGSVAGFLAFGWDKFRAGRERSRVSEKLLHLISALGGWPGAVLGQQYFRHKTLKVRFRLILTTIIAVHVLVAAWRIWSTMRPSGPTG